MAITASMVKDLRDKTGAGMMDCKKALQETDGDFEKAIDHLRERGVAAAAKRADRVAKEGLVASYIHPGSKLGVLVEVNCETDFVARTEDFEQFSHDVAMQVAASNPLVVKREDIAPETIEHEKEIYRTLAINEGRPERALDRIVEGRLEKYYQEACLLEQPFIKDPDKTVNDLLTELIAKIGENILIRRFARFRLGDDE